MTDNWGHPYRRRGVHRRNESEVGRAGLVDGIQ
jgi:hypothetical protein